MITLYLLMGQVITGFELQHSWLCFRRFSKGFKSLRLSIVGGWLIMMIQISHPRILDTHPRNLDTHPRNLDTHPRNLDEPLDINRILDIKNPGIMKLYLFTWCDFICLATNRCPFYQQMDLANS
ncbi:hypothetical protein NPIL_185421 [Nephila pilipes]|uniref:Uncharacterized protein n=1 Tax=Nephila pilipes TaxID=299642 RepID=A0A8X6PFA5_NEPPI|nr:hypothetical protein NPIL_185421 [Nephila pilipes]